MMVADQADDWLRATVEAAGELCDTTLGVALNQCQHQARLPENLTGCIVALVGVEESIQVGLASDSQGCQSLARALFCSDEDLPESDVADALGEIANIVAGGVKKRKSHSHSAMVLGLPLVMVGQLRLSERQVLAQNDVLMGDIPVRVWVICNRE